VLKGRFCLDHSKLSTPLDDDQVTIEGETVRDIARLIKTRLAKAGRLSAVPCAWCLPLGQKSQAMKMEAYHQVKLFKFHGFHCATHADDFHQLAKLGNNLRFSCCDVEINAVEELTGLMAQLNLQED
jgi:hypothetical protein